MPRIHYGALSRLSRQWLTPSPGRFDPPSPSVGYSLSWLLLLLFSPLAGRLNERFGPQRAYAQLKEAVPPQVVATAMGVLNLFFWLGGASYQHASGLILDSFPKEGVHIALAGYRTVFCLCLASVGLSVILAVCSKEQGVANIRRIP